ncbi:MAG: ATP-binding protein, partial [Magnetococcus sp. DMHC-8]
MTPLFCTTKPIAMWNREIQTDFKKLFLNLAEGTIHLTTQEWKAAAGHALEALSAIELAHDDCGARAWLLIHRALTEALFQLAGENTAPCRQTIADPVAFVEALNLDQTLEQQPICLDHRFFVHPERCALLAHLERPLRQWLEANGHDPTRARCISQRLPSYFVFALNNQWRKQPTEYLCLQQTVATPFTQAAAREQGWHHYRAWLQKQVDEPLSGESASLRALHVPLRGWQTGPDGQSPGVRVVDLHTALWQWLHDAHPHDAVRLLCGGPGTGKTATAKMFAAAVAGEGIIPVLFIPLHLLPERAGLVEAVRAWVAADPYCDSYTPLAELDDRERLLLIMDGLEEWAMRHESLSGAARQFVEEIGQLTTRFNQRETRLQILLTERTPLCAAHADQFRLPGQVLHLLSYSPAAAGGWPGDADALLPPDQRPAWWARHGQTRGNAARHHPAPWQVATLTELTTHPLANHLLAQAMAQDRIDPGREEGVNRLCQELVAGLFKRTYDGGRNPATRGWTEEI